MIKIKIWFIVFFLLLAGRSLANKLKCNFYCNYSYYWQNFNTSSQWNPNNVFHLTESDSRLALNPEGRLNMKKIGFFVSPLVTVNHSGKSKFEFREATVTLNLGKIEITGGRGIIKFGTGYIFNPIGIVSPEKQLSDPEDLQRTQLGSDLLKIDYYMEKFNLSASVFKKTNWKNIALSIYGNLEGFDLYGVLYYPEYKKFEFGLAFATTIGESVEVHAEGMMRRRSPVLYHRVYEASDPRIVYPDWPLVQPPDDYYKEFLVGTNTTVKTINIIMEYYHNDWGLKTAWWQRLKKHFAYNFPGMADAVYSQNVYSDLEILRQGQRGLFRDYLFIRVFKSFKNIDLSTVFFINLADGSFLSLLQLNYTPGNGITFYLQPFYFSGKAGSEFGGTFYSSSLQLSMRLVL